MSLKNWGEPIDVSQIDHQCGRLRRRFSTVHALLLQVSEATGLEGFSCAPLSTDLTSFELATPLGSLDATLGFRGDGIDLVGVVLVSRNNPTTEKKVPVCALPMGGNGVPWLGIDDEPLPLSHFSEPDFQTGVMMLSQFCTAQLKSLADEAATYRF